MPEKISHTEQPDFTFCEAEAIAIVEAVVRSKADRQKRVENKPELNKLVKDLNIALMFYRGWTRRKSETLTKSQYLKLLRSTQVRSENLRRDLAQLIENYYSRHHIVPDAIVFGAWDQAEELLLTIGHFEAKLHLIETNVRAHKTQRGNRAGFDDTTDFVARLLPNVYKDHFGKPAVSRTPSGQASGPMLRFIQCVLNYLAIELSDEAVVSAVMRYRRQYGRLEVQKKS